MECGKLHNVMKLGLHKFGTVPKIIVTQCRVIICLPTLLLDL